MHDTVTVNEDGADNVTVNVWFTVPASGSVTAGDDRDATVGDASLSLIVPVAVPCPDAMMAFVGLASVKRERLVGLVEGVVHDRDVTGLARLAGDEGDRPRRRGVVGGLVGSAVGCRVVRRSPA